MHILLGIYQRELSKSVLYFLEMDILSLSDFFDLDFEQDLFPRLLKVLYFRQIAIFPSSTSLSFTENPGYVESSSAVHYTSASIRLVTTRDVLK